MSQVLGTFGRVIKKAVENTESEPVFDLINYCGEDIRLSAWQSPVAMMRMSEVINDGYGRAFVPATASIYVVLRECIHSDDWAMFERLTKVNEVSIPELSELAERLYIWWSNRPFQSRSESSPGGAIPETEEQLPEHSSEQSTDSAEVDSGTSRTGAPETASIT